MIPREGKAVRTFFESQAQILSISSEHKFDSSEERSRDSSTCCQQQAGFWGSGVWVAL